MWHIVVGDRLVSLPALAAVGLAIGFVAGMFGVGGGFILTPLLALSFKIPMPIAVGSALCQKIGTSISSFLKHRQYRHGEIRVDFVMVGASMVGVDAGTRLLALLAELGTFTNARGRPVSIVAITIEGIYAAMLLFAASMTVNAARRNPQATDARSPSSVAPLVRFGVPPYLALPEVGIPKVSVIVMAYIGFATGLLSGLLGIGGGVALLPVLIYGYGFSIKDAAGTGILLLFATVVVGTLEHALRHNVDLRVALAILAGSSIGSQLGART
ncbi:MAG TPA: sulfite exporter TauE/SafE family protein, partial [Polyangia bacterium]|nr:sulfite exporter TauE/SafE family protein [Polyangia bacterium]